MFLEKLQRHYELSDKIKSGESNAETYKFTRELVEFCGYLNNHFQTITGIGSGYVTDWESTPQHDNLLIRSLWNRIRRRERAIRKRIADIERKYNLGDQTESSLDFISDYLPRNLEFRDQSISRFVRSHFLFVEVYLATSKHLPENVVGYISPALNRGVGSKFLHEKDWGDKHKNLPFFFVVSGEGGEEQEHKTRLHELKHAIDYLIADSTSELSAHLFGKDLSGWYLREEGSHTFFVGNGEAVSGSNGEANQGISQMVTKQETDKFLDIRLPAQIKSYFITLYPNYLGLLGIHFGN